jgi:hypothetical protein
MSVSFQEFGTTNALEFDGLIGRGERALPALRSGVGVAVAIARRWRSIMAQAPSALVNGQRPRMARLGGGVAVDVGPQAAIPAPRYSRSAHVAKAIGGLL